MNEDQIKGKLKETEGSLTGDPARESEGQAQQAGGKAQEGLDKAKDALGDAKDAITGK